ncbi:MAG: uracil-DNA glycosylase [Lentisphaeria bacterium]|nr:uracil-DNA glycosylase [Lentisphaeria bacterium]
MTAFESFPEEWRRVIAEPFLTPLERVHEARDNGAVVYPPEGKIFTALRLTPPQNVRAVILGQDPYHEPEQAMGLAFAVPQTTKAPPSLQNILKEYCADMGLAEAPSSDLTAWARHGVLLLNTLLSVEEGKPLSHQKFGWQKLTDQILEACNNLPQTIAFILWGRNAIEKRRLIDEQRHIVIAGPHPSPLSAYRGFFGSKPFTTANRMLAAKGAAPIDWTL